MAFARIIAPMKPLNSVDSTKAASLDWPGEDNSLINKGFAICIYRREVRISLSSAGIVGTWGNPRELFFDLYLRYFLFSGDVLRDLSLRGWRCHWRIASAMAASFSITSAPPSEIPLVNSTVPTVPALPHTDAGSAWPALLGSGRRRCCVGPDEIRRASGCPDVDGDGG